MPDDTRRGRDEIAIDREIGLAQAYAIATGAASPQVAPEARDRCRASHRRLGATIAARRHVYGLTTGFGPLADRLVDPGDGVLLQQNLIHHLASGQGPDFAWDEARAIALARLMSILQGLSGASEASIDALVSLLRSDLAPAIPSRGTVGASGDLTPLSHLALCLQGRADFLTRCGRRIDGAAALTALGLAPLDLERRDGLALVNGTSAMTGVALCNAVRARRLAEWSIALTAGLAEAMAARLEAWDMAFADARPHPGQRAATSALLARVAGASRLVVAPIAARELRPDENGQEARIGQDAYTIRCAPQVIGAVLDTLDWHDAVVLRELSSVTDNPIFPEDREVPALHGGNFMGQHVGLVSDSLANAVTVLAGLAERQVARLTDERLNNGLPAFLHMGRAGLNSGFMGAQVTATAILAEMRSRGPASMHSISTNGANQDVVSMGTVAARITAASIEDAATILAILALTVTQAMDILDERAEGGFSPSAQTVRGFVRIRSDRLAADRPLGEEIATLARALCRHSPPA
ncbi:aromatic amino acid ammonia-lyase [Roseibacterium sp. SDUM158017]|uniref:HAL/PAL/TAL family ammonia-lyase n=1 Tax=Roseicyclus salinarum TaxID=3036773 RepID=UPI00241583B5|nr:aromatic amino acid ammonia-lyase [Roseibacterium sp. SDUM158017]MDG4648414.1 aromatic amino acid ammonia-lyase [Roseibacterium sp. SDUM158017]